MLTVSLKPLHHRNQECIGIYYRPQPSLNTLIKKLPGIKWSQTNQCWYFPLDNDSYSKVYRVLKEKVEVDISLLKEYLEKRRAVAITTASSGSAKNIVKRIPLSSPVLRLSTENLQALEKFVQYLKLKSLQRIDHPDLPQ